MSNLAKIVLPLDFSDRCRGAARYARALADRAHSEITLLHVLEPPYVLGAPEGAGSIFLSNRLAQAQEQLDAWLEDELRGLAVNRVVLEGAPALKIVEYAQSQQAGLIMMPTHGYGRFRRFLLGSVTAKVLHDAECPVWTGVHSEESPPAEQIELGHVVCAVDLGPQSARTFCWAHRIACTFGARLTLVHSVPDLDHSAGYVDPEFWVYLISAAKEELARLQLSLGIHADVYTETGEPAKALRLAAQQLGADLLVIGRGSESGIFGGLRANAYAIIRQSPCPVVSV